jgi:hypothetical protein
MRFASKPLPAMSKSAIDVGSGHGLPRQVIVSEPGWIGKVSPLLLLITDVFGPVVVL